MPSIAWFVTTTSASFARLRARCGKHSSSIEQRGPRHSIDVTDTCRHARSLTPGTRSSRSPVSVSSAHARSAHHLGTEVAEPLLAAPAVAGSPRHRLSPRCRRRGAG